MKSREEYKAILRAAGFTPADACSKAKVSFTTLNNFFRNHPKLHQNSRKKLNELFEEIERASKVSA